MFLWNHEFGISLIENRVGFTEMYVDCLSSEAVTSFLLYGNVTYRNKTTMFPRWIAKRFNLNKHGFGDKQSVGISNFSLVELSPNVQRAKCTYADLSLKTTIRALCRNRIKPRWIRPIIKRGASLEDLSENIIDAIRHCAVINFNDEPSKHATRREILKQLKNHGRRIRRGPPFQYVDTTTLIARIFTASLDSFKFVSWLVEVSCVSLNSRRWARFQHIIGEKLSMLIFQTGLLLIIPVRPRGRQGIQCIPVDGAQETLSNQLHLLSARQLETYRTERSKFYRNG